MSSPTRTGTIQPPVRVLVIEDSASDARLALAALEEATLHRFRASIATTIAGAVPHLGDADVVLLDLNLPDARQLEGLARIRQERPDVPVIVLTGDPAGPTTEAALAQGAQDYLAKDDLSGAALDRAIAHARVRQALIARVEASERWARALVHSVSDVISIHGADGQLQHLGGQGAAILAWSDPPCMDDLRCVVDRRTWLRMIRSFRRWRRLGFGSLEFTVSLPDIGERHLESVATDMLDDPAIAGIVVTTRDVTDRHVIAERLSHEATHDALTDLPNRTLFHERLHHALARQHRTGGPVALLMVELDNFKDINDSYGHPAGDQVLRSVSALLTVGLRSQDTLARLGGDEFAIVCPDLTAHAAERVARRLQRALTRPFTADGHEVYVTASVGIALSEADAPVDATGLLRNADLALYQSKGAGRSFVSLFDDRLEQRARRRMEVETELRGALLRDELSVVYQPVVDLRSGRVHSHEALLRWHHPRLGDVSPDEFVPIAEDCGLIVPFGRWVLERACVQVAEWRRADPSADARIGVNVSTRQLVDPSFVPELLDVLQRTDVPAAALSLEVTETALIAEMADSSDVLHHLRELGVEVALDDFGTGYSSLTYLKHLPVDVLKIDRSFIEGVGHDPHDQAVVGAVIQMAKALGMTIVAEGVEEVAQRDRLRSLGCDRVQGFLFSAAVPHDAVLSAIQRVHDVGDEELPATVDDPAGVRAPTTAAEVSSAIADLVHELMQPLTVVKSFSDEFRLLAGSDDRDQTLAIADAIARNAATAVTIVRSLADAGALERGSLDLHRQRTQLRPVIEDLVADLRLTTDVPIDVEIVPDVEVDLDRDRFRQIVTNLVTNAAKFTPPGTPVVVRLAASDVGDALVSVIDSGPGIPTELRHALFDKYRRHGQQRGTGVGLYIARKLARLHGGDLQHRRAHTGGAELVLRLPHASADLVGPHPTVAAPSRSAERATALGSDDPGAVIALHRATRELLRARSPERVVSISIGLVRDLGGTVVPAAFADPAAIPIDLSMGHGPPLLPSAPPLTVARLRLERVLPLYAEDARDAMQSTRGLGDDRRFDAETGVLTRWPLLRSMRSIPDCSVLVVRVPGGADGRRTLARVLRSITDSDVIGVWGPDALVVACDADVGHELVDDLRDEWSKWGSPEAIDIALVAAGSSTTVEDQVHLALEQLCRP